MNMMIITGRVASEPERRVTRNGRSYLRYRFAVEDGYRKDLKKVDVFFITVIAWNNLANRQEKILHKGVRILMKGSIKMYEGVDSMGKTIENAVFVPTSMEYIDARAAEDPVTDLRGSDGKPMLPREVTDSFKKIVNASDEDIPDDVFGYR